MPELSQIKDLGVLVLQESNYGMLHECNSANCLDVGSPIGLLQLALLMQEFVKIFGTLRVDL